MNLLNSLCRPIAILLSPFAMVAALALPIGVWTSSANADDNWPQFRGPHADAVSQNVVPTKWSETENVRWKTPLHDKGWSSPVIWGDQVWLTTATKEGHTQWAICVDKKTGKIVHDIKLFENAEPKKTASFNSFASPTPILEAGRAYITFGSYGTACLEMDSGKVLWQRRDLECDHWRGPGSSPIIYGKLLILPFDGYDFQYVVALNKETGETVWKSKRDVDYGTTDGDVMKAYCTPLVIKVGDQDQLIAPTSKAALAYDPTTGKEIWRVRYSSFSTTGMPLFDGKTLFINTGFGKADLLAIRPDGKGDVTDSNILWKQTKGIGSKTSQLLVDGLIYNVHDEGIANCVEAETGKEVWQKRLNGKFTASPLYAGGHIYFFSSDNGVGTVIKPGRTFEEVASNKLNAGCMASPAVSGKSLFVRTDEALYCIEQ